MEQVANFIHRATQIAVDIQSEKGKKIKDFEAGIEENQAILDLKKDVEAWAEQLDYPCNPILQN